MGPINTVEDLQREQRRLKGRIRVQEKELRQRVKQVPGELFYAGVNSVIPAMLSGKITNTALNFGKNFINKVFVKKDGEEANSKLFNSARQIGLLALLKIGFNAFMNRK
ncbi:MAG TPA: hypothetical protein VGM41_11750 [Chitinophagaceae bacterium]|jgi:hypothetical protein